MSSPSTSRRAFLSSGAALFGGAWLTINLPVLEALSRDARRAAARGARFTTLTPAEASTMSAFADQILPSGELPGATEAGVIYFIDRGLGTHFAGMLESIRAGLADLDVRARAVDPPAADFAGLENTTQFAIMRAIEATPFFFQARMLTIMGMLSDPSYGGNQDGAGWRLLGMEHQGSYQPPFGHYDAELARAPRGSKR